MPLRRLLPGLLLAAAALAAEPAAARPDRATVPPLRTSIYVGSVVLATTEFRREGERFAATYEAKVFPWFFWGETGAIAIVVPDADLDRLARGETIEFTGDARNHKGKPRRVTGRAQPTDAASGRIKVRIAVDDVALVFDGPYRLASGARLSTEG